MDRVPGTGKDLYRRVENSGGVLRGDCHDRVIEVREHCRRIWSVSFTFLTKGRTPAAPFLSAAARPKLRASLTHKGAPPEAIIPPVASAVKVQLTSLANEPPPHVIM